MSIIPEITTIRQEIKESDLAGAYG